MIYPDNLYSVKTEASVIGGIMKTPSVIIELDNFLSDKDFVNNVHRVVFSIIKNQVLNNKTINPVIIAQNCQNIGIKNFEEINLYDYLDSISYSPVSKDGVIDLSKQLMKLRIRRELWDNAEAIKRFVSENGDKSLDELINGTDGIYNSKIIQYENQIEPVDLYSNIENFIKEIAKAPVEEVGFKTPYFQWNRLFGGIRQKQTINIISRSGEGKSCFLFNMAKNICKLNNVKALYIDTEMDLDLNMFRAAASEMQMNAWYLETGQWTKNKELVDKAVNGFNKLREYNGSIYHIYLPNKPIKETIALMKRWYYKNVGRGKKCIFVYDYLKITEQLERNKQEHAALGDMLNYLNELNHETNSSLLTAGQQNRVAESMGVRNDDSTTAAASDRINHLVSFNAVFRKKTPDELSEFGEQYGTHLLKPFKTSRVQGKDNYNMNNIVKTIGPDGKVKWRQNFVNYDIKDYNLVEKGTYQDIVKDNALNKPLQKDNKKEISLF